MIKQIRCWGNLVIISCAVILWGCKHEKNELVHDHAHEHHHEHEAENHNSDEIIVEPEMAEKMGVETAVVKAGPFAAGILVSGRIESASSGNGLATASTSGIFTLKQGLAIGSTVKKGEVIGYIDTKSANGGDVNAMAKANLVSTKAELDRLTPLYEKKLVTAETYNAAKAAYETAKSAYSPRAASGTVTAPVSGVIISLDAAQGQYVEPGQTIARISDGSKLYLIVDFPARNAHKAQLIKNAEIIDPETHTSIDIADFNGKRLSESSVSTSAGYIPIVFSFDNANAFYPGQIVEVYLLGGSEEDVISLPLSAISEQQGAYFVYVKIDEEGYIKTPVITGQRSGSRIQIESGLKGGEEVVVKGVTALRLAETSGAVPEGHSHPH